MKGTILHTNFIYRILWDEHINEYVTFPINPTTLIISVTHGLLQTKPVYVLDNMDAHEVLPLNSSLMDFHALSM